MRVWITGERKASLNFGVESLSQTNCFDIPVKLLLLFWDPFGIHVSEATFLYEVVLTFRFISYCIQLILFIS